MIVVQQGDDNDRAGMHDVFSAGALPIWQSDDVAPCLKEASVEQRLAFKQGFDQVGVGGFGHEGSDKNGYLSMSACCPANLNKSQKDGRPGALRTTGSSRTRT